MSYTIEGLGYGVFIKDTATSQIKYFFGVSTALKFERDNLGILLNSQNVDAVGGFLLLTNSVDNTELNGVVTPFNNSDPNATKNLFIFISQNLQGGSAVPVTNIWTQSAGEVSLVDTNQSLVLGDLGQTNLTPAYFNFSDSQKTPVLIIQNSAKTNITRKYQNRRQVKTTETQVLFEVEGIGGNAAATGTLTLNCIDEAVGTQGYTATFFITAAADTSTDIQLIKEYVDITLTPPNVSLSFVGGTLFVNVENLALVNILAAGTFEININKI